MPSRQFRELPGVTLADEMLRAAEHILETKAAEFDLSMLEDHYQNAVQMLREKQKGMPEQVRPASFIASERDQLDGRPQAQRGGQTSHFALSPAMIFA